MNDWISVKDRLPKDSERVLCFNGKVNVVLYNEAKWLDEGSDYVWSVEPLNVTHWMPLPAQAEETIHAASEELSKHWIKAAVVDGPHVDTKPFEVPKDGRSYLCWTGSEGMRFVWWSTSFSKYLDSYISWSEVHEDSITRYMNANGNWVERG